MPSRPRYEMPDFIGEALHQHKLMDAYRSRPPYQQNDYIGTLCVTPARLEATRKKRLNQMLDELKGGKLYMNMEWTKSHTL
jgi:Bacteriocin-protection, YdeI or OmpD-Associated